MDYGFDVGEKSASVISCEFEIFRGFDVRAGERNW